MSAPPAHPRHRSRNLQQLVDDARAQELPLIGDWFQRTTDHSVHQVTNIFERERRVQLVPSWGPERYMISFKDLARLYRKVSS